MCDLHKLVGGDLSTVSRHLGVMKEAGIIEVEKRGTSVYCSLALACLDTFLHCTGEVIKSRLLARLNDAQSFRETR